jgi:hypothetical protein
MDLHRIPQWICIGPWSLIHFSYHARWLLLVRPKLNFLSWSDHRFWCSWKFRSWIDCSVHCWINLYAVLLVLMCLHHSNLILIDSLNFRFPLFLLKVRSVRMLNTIVCSGPSVWLYSIPSPGRMLCNFLPVHDAESLPCTVWVIWTDPNGTLCMLIVQKMGFPVVLCV